MARVLERVTATVRQQELFLPGQEVLACVSGGADSVCLVESLVRLRRLLRIRVSVFHFDHGLRPDSGKDVVYVERLADRLGLPFHLRRAEASPPRGDSVEAWARNERVVAISEVLRETGAGRAALGHTLDDQAETVLMRAISGSGIDGLAGIKPGSGPWAHPLLDVRRAETEAFCRSLRLRPRTDPTNRDRRYLRNAIRLDAIPAVERAVGREIREPLARTAALLRDDADELSRRLFETWDEVFTETPDGGDLSVVGLLGLSPAIAGRVVRHAIFRCGHPAQQTDVEAVLDLARGRPGRRRDLSSGLKAGREREYVHFSRPSPA